ncbi:copper resistance protein [Pseudoroseomonas rhizosphaerae]|uniref:Copper resistance protein n=1 Tax=Teichococcus rhizosphaerae TaxID=1335062 RepID=A0A2C7AAL2_9PROT|nr:CopD family protein [Pseudoroseomonas rhizosphaerae]PHK94116.1 copper resistance protein [Pseudoroseomonas rhizosphaerae]
MILELLGAEPDPLRALSVALRLAHYASCLGAAGLAIFAMGFGRLQEAGDVAACRRLTLVMVAAGLGSSLAWLAAQVALASDGDPFDAEVWDMMLASRPGISVLVAWAGLLAVALATGIGRAALVLGAAGVLAVAASFTQVGHTTQHQPRWLLATALVVHLLAAAFWAGSLWPLAIASRRAGPRAASMVEGWARAASWVVAGLVVAGATLAWLLVGQLDLLVTTAYGWALLAKVALVGALLGFAAWHRFRLTPALAAGAPGSGARLAASIAWEIVVMVLVFWAVAEMTSTSPRPEGV